MTQLQTVPRTGSRAARAAFVLAFLAGLALICLRLMGEWAPDAVTIEEYLTGRRAAWGAA